MAKGFLTNQAIDTSKFLTVDSTTPGGTINVDADTVKGHGVTNDVIQGSEDLITSGGVYNAMNKITAGTTDLTAGTSPLPAGTIYLVYE